MLRCAVFDFDGTLVDSNRIKHDTFFAVARDVDPGGERMRKLLERLVRADRERVMLELARELRAAGELDDDDSWAKARAADYTRLCEEAISACPEIPGARSALEWLSGRGCALFVSSGTPTRPLRRLLERRSLAGHFRGAYGGPATKVENLRRILGGLGAAPRDCLLVGDGADDLEAAGALGVPCALVERGSAPRRELDPEFRIADLSALPAVVRALEEGDVTRSGDR